MILFFKVPSVRNQIWQIFGQKWRKPQSNLNSAHFFIWYYRCGGPMHLPKTQVSDKRFTIPLINISMYISYASWEKNFDNNCIQLDHVLLRQGVFRSTTSSFLLLDTVVFRYWIYFLVTQWTENTEKIPKQSREGYAKIWHVNMKLPFSIYKSGAKISWNWTPPICSFFIPYCTQVFDYWILSIFSSCGMIIKIVAKNW